MNNNRLEEKRNGGKKKELLYYIKNQAIRVICQHCADLTNVLAALIQQISMVFFRYLKKMYSYFLFIGVFNTEF